MTDSKKDFNAGYSKCCNDVAEVLGQIPEGADKEYITHYLLNELFSKFYLIAQGDDTT